jgi:sporulation protein YlmC with PRC-barrel domain
MERKDVFEIKHQSRPFAKTVETSKISGKRVISRDGRKLGFIEAIHIHPTRLTVEGIRVKRGLFEMQDYIGREYIQSLTTSGAVLKIVPAREIMGLTVYDLHGKRVGKIKSINRSRKTNNIVSFTVGRGFRRKDAVIPGKQIKEIGKGVTLRVTFSD